VGKKIKGTVQKSANQKNIYGPLQISNKKKDQGTKASVKVDENYNSSINHTMHKEVGPDKVQ